jgi:hypothetical protein
MAAKSGDKSPKVEKSVKKDKSDKKSKKDKKSSGEKQDKTATVASLLADKKAVNPALSSLFAAQVQSIAYLNFTSIPLTNTAHTTHSPRDRPGARRRV